jgi:DNA-binding NarL/FixJ family response regulator
MDALRQTETLPERDLQILRLVAEGTSNREIGDRLGFTESSVKQHINAIREKLGAKDRTHAAIIAQKRGLI